MTDVGGRGGEGEGTRGKGDWARTERCARRIRLILQCLGRVLHTYVTRSKSKSHTSPPSAREPLRPRGRKTAGPPHVEPGGGARRGWKA